MRFLSEIRAIPGALYKLSGVVQELANLHRERGPSEARLEDLERSRAQWEAEVGALILKADSTYKAAAASESRARTTLKNAEKLADPFAEEGDEVQTPVPGGYDPRGQEEEVLHMPVAVARNDKTLARRYKFQ